MLKTEMRNPKTTHIDQMSALEIGRIMNEENMAAILAVDREMENIAAAIDRIAQALTEGGRLFYVGAGSSGRLGILDAAECPPTFGVSSDTVVGIMAGGAGAMVKAQEGVEDDPEAGLTDLKAYDVNQKDVVVGISASGGAAYVMRALEYAGAQGACTVGITSNKESKLADMADISICPDTGAEVVTGSTRLKAGTAQKIILNMLSTGAMIRSGYVYENLMINVKPANEKLSRRVIRIVEEITGKDSFTCEKLLEENQWDIKKAVSKISP